MEYHSDVYIMLPLGHNISVLPLLYASCALCEVVMPSLYCVCIGILLFSEGLLWVPVFLPGQEVLYVCYVISCLQ